jgi:uncharacterized protein (TIRG00374 family)
LRLLPWIIGAALLVWGIRFVSWDEVAAILRRLQPWQIAVLVVANAVVLAAISARWWWLLAGAGHRLPFLPVVGYRLAVFGLSYFTPGPHVGGEPLQLLLVEKNHAVPRSGALAAVTLDKAIEFGVNFAFLLLGIAAALQWRVVPQETGRQALGLAATLLALPLFYLVLAARDVHPLARAFAPLAGRWPRLSPAAATLAESESLVGSTIRRAPRTFVAAVLITLVSWAALIAEYWLMVRFLGTSLTLPQLVVSLTAARISILLLLPAGLGALELSQALAFGALGLDPALGISLGLLIRARDTALGLFGLWWGGRAVRQWVSRSVGQ